MIFRAIDTPLYRLARHIDPHCGHRYDPGESCWDPDVG